MLICLKSRTVLWGAIRSLKTCLLDWRCFNPWLLPNQRHPDVASPKCKQVSCGVVYSLHKSSTRAHIQRTAERELRAASAEVLAQLRFDLPASYAFHRCSTSPMCSAIYKGHTMGAGQDAFHRYGSFPMRTCYLRCQMHGSRHPMPSRVQHLPHA